MGTNSINDMLSTSPIGAELDSNEIQSLAAVITTQQLKEDDTLIEEGHKDDALYIVVNGSLIATRCTGGNDYVTLHSAHGRYSRRHGFH